MNDNVKYPELLLAGFIMMIWQTILSVIHPGVEWLLGKLLHVSRVMRKPAFCIFKNKDADQLRSNCAADQRLCFR